MSTKRSAQDISKAFREAKKARQEQAQAQAKAQAEAKAQMLAKAKAEAEAKAKAEAEAKARADAQAMAPPPQLGRAAREPQEAKPQPRAEPQPRAQLQPDSETMAPPQAVVRRPLVEADDDDDDDEPVVGPSSAVAVPEDPSPGSEAMVVHTAKVLPGEPDAGDAAEAEKPETLPEGFFDDPDADARVRGVETPAERAKRELEEGLKRFEREMVIEAEIAEEVRHELDEERYEKVAAEEDAFQQSLRERLEGLKAQASQRLNTKKPSSSEEDGREETGAKAESAEEDADSGSDVEFDWRAKGFG